jgi:antitoxin Phd
MRMRKTYTFSEARQKLAAVLDNAEKDGEVRIVRRNGVVFIVQPEKSNLSPLDVPGLNVNIRAEDIVEVVREGRERLYQTGE